MVRFSFSVAFTGLYSWTDETLLTLLILLGSGFAAVSCPVCLSGPKPAKPEDATDI